MAIAENLLTIKQYADLKVVDRSKIYKLIKDGKIIPQDFLGRQCIDVTQYGALDVEEALKEKNDQLEKLALEQKKLKSENVDLKNRLNKLENVVFVRSESGRGPAKNKK